MESQFIGITVSGSWRIGRGEGFTCATATSEENIFPLLCLFHHLLLRQRQLNRGSIVTSILGRLPAVQRLLKVTFFQQ